MTKKRVWQLIIMLTTLAMVISACGGATPTAVEPAVDTKEPVKEPTKEPVKEPVTITVWDYYGEATPIEPIIEGFEAANPDIKVKVESLDWDSTLEKLNVVLAGGTAPDVVTVDMTWLPTFAALDAFADLKPLSDGQLNGVPLEQAYSSGALDAMSYKDKVLTMLYDFDVYSLYYRSDLLEEKGLDVPTNWEELLNVASQVVDGDLYRYAFMPDTFHGSQWIYENGGGLLNADNTAAIFNAPEGVEATEFYTGLLDEGVAINWTPDEGEFIQGIKDGRIAMFSDGPYVMGIMKDAAPEMSGQWRVATHPYNKQPGSYLGGTGLVIPATSDHQDAAWKFIEYAMTVENQIGVFEYAGAAPALTEALESPEVNVEDPYFGGQRTLSVFLEAMKTASPFPYVRQWDEIDGAFTVALEEIALGTKSAQQALDDAASTVDSLLSE